VRRISSGLTFLMKRVFPVFWFGVLAIVTISMLAAWRSGESTQLTMIIVVPLVMAVLGYLIMRQLVFGLVDEVWDGGDFLVVKTGGTETRVPFSDIIDVDFLKLSNPERATLTLRNQTQLGTKISFLAPTRLINVGTHPLKGEIEQRAAQARQR
jgi:hypothetical protein